MILHLNDDDDDDDDEEEEDCWRLLLLWVDLGMKEENNDEVNEGVDEEAAAAARCWDGDGEDWLW